MFRGRVPDVPWILGSLLHHVEVRTLEMGSGHLCTPYQVAGKLFGPDFPEIAEKKEHVLIGACQRCGKAGSGAVDRMAARRTLYVRGAAVHEIETAAPVGVEVYETGHYVGIAVIDQMFSFMRNNRALRHSTNPAARDTERTGNDFVPKDDFTFENHITIDYTTELQGNTAK